MKKVFVIVVLYNDTLYIDKVLEGLLNQKEFIVNKNLFISFIDNGSTDDAKNKIKKYNDLVHFKKTYKNIGFCGGNNLGLSYFLKSDCDYVLLLNPDLFLKDDAIINFIKSIEENHVDAVTPLLLQTDNNLSPIIPYKIDSSGIVFTKSIRHFDRFNGIERDKCTIKNGLIAGGTGACFFMKKDFVKKMEIKNTNYEDDLYKVYPALKDKREERFQFFDEAFFAYREDADISWRAYLLGCKIFFDKSCIGYHKRRVTSKNRQELNKFINSLGIKNRFLLQVNNFSFLRDYNAIFSGIIIRNLIVIIAVFFRERSSINGLKEFVILFKRALEIRKQFKARWTERKSIFKFKNE